VRRTGGRGATRALATSVLVVATAVALTLVPAAAASADSIRDAQYWLSDYGVERASRSP